MHQSLKKNLIRGARSMHVRFEYRGCLLNNCCNKWG